MRIQFAVLRIIVFVVLAKSCSFAEAQKIVKRVVIHSVFYSLGNSRITQVTIKRKGKKFVSNDRPVSAALVQSLAAALSAPPLTKPDMTNLGITQEWLASKFESPRLPERIRRADKATASQEKLFRKSFTDLNLVANVLPDLFIYEITDTLLFCRVEIVFDDGSKLSAESYSFYDFMLPWRMTGDRLTYNADISRAIAALLPDESANKSTLAGEEMAYSLGLRVMRSIEPEWNLLGSEERAGEALKALRTSYEVITAELTPYLESQYGIYAYFDALEETDLHATIRRSNFPSNVTDTLVLRYADEKVEGVDAFLKSAAKYEDLVLSVPWLKVYIRDNPRASVRISYFHGKSFGDKAMDVFAADMKRLNRDDLIEQVKSQQAGIALLLIDDSNTKSNWLLFPDKHMMLWRYDGSSRLLKWKPENFRNGECSDSLMLHPIVCSGREITAEGMLAPSTSR